MSLKISAKIARLKILYFILVCNKKKPWNIRLFCCLNHFNSYMVVNGDYRLHLNVINSDFVEISFQVYHRSENCEPLWGILRVKLCNKIQLACNRISDEFYQSSSTNKPITSFVHYDGELLWMITTNNMRIKVLNVYLASVITSNDMCWVNWIFCAQKNEMDIL